MAIERVDFDVYVVSNVFDSTFREETHSYMSLISKIIDANHPIKKDLIEIVNSINIGGKTVEPRAFYGNIPSVNGVPRK